MDCFDDWDWDTQAILYLAFGTIAGLIIFFSVCYACCHHRRRQRRSRKSVISIQTNLSNQSAQPMDEAPVVVTTSTTQHVPFTPSQQMQHTVIQSHQTGYPMGQQGYVMPMPAPNQHSYPMPQPGYPHAPYASGGAPYPPAGPHENMNPPSYDQVVGTTTTNESYVKQAPYNPSYPG